MSASLMARVTTASPWASAGDVATVPETLVSKGAAGMPEATASWSGGVVEAGAEEYDAEADPESWDSRAAEVPALWDHPGRSGPASGKRRDDDEHGNTRDGAADVARSPSAPCRRRVARPRRRPPRQRMRRTRASPREAGHPSPSPGRGARRWANRHRPASGLPARPPHRCAGAAALVMADGEEHVEGQGPEADPDGR